MPTADLLRLCAARDRAEAFTVVQRARHGGRELVRRMPIRNPLAALAIYEQALPYSAQCWIERNGRVLWPRP